MAIGNFKLTAADIGWRGVELSRPECVLAERDGTLWASDSRGGVTRIDADGRQSVIGKLPGLPNGLALERSGSLLVADIDGARLFRLFRDGHHEIVLDTLDGAPLHGVNFVYCDPHGDRVWLTISTRTSPRSDAVKTPTPDGYVVLLDRGKARIAADGFCFTNEVRIDREGRFLYVAETARGRVVRLPLGPDGSLGRQEVFGPETFFPGARVDGIAFDDEGNLWVTEIVRNGIYVIAPDGTHVCVFEDPSAATVNFPASLCFAGPDLRTVYIGSTRMNRLASFRAPVAGAKLAHWR